MADSSPRSGWAVLRHRDFKLLVGGTLVSHTGDILQNMAVQWLVFQLTHSAFKLGIIGFCWMIPRLVLGALGGVIADRVDRRRLLIVTQTIAMAQSLIMFALVVTGRITFAELVVLTVVLGIADSLHFTARHAFVPLLVPPDELQSAVALNSATMNLTQILGPSLGGIMIGLVGTSGCLAVNAASFVAILLALFAMNWRPVARPAPQTSLLAELIDGFRHVGARERLWVPIGIAYAVAGLAMAFSRILPVYAVALDVGERGFGWLQTAPGVGAIVASLAIAARGKRPGAFKRLYLAVGVLVAALGLFAEPRNMQVALFALAVVGGAQMVFRTTAIAMCHEATDDAHRGRVMSIFLLDYGLWSFGTLWLGWLCDARGPAVAVLTGAGSCLAVTAAVAYMASVRRRTR